MKEYTICNPKTILFEDITCTIDCSNKEGRIKPIEITWIKNDKEYTPTLKDWKYILEQCLDEKWSIFHQMNDISEAFYDYACFGGIMETILRNVRVDAIDFEREAYIASIVDRYVINNKETDEVKQYLEECEKDKEAREGLKNFFKHKNILSL